MPRSPLNLITEPWELRIPHCETFNFHLPSVPSPSLQIPYQLQTRTPHATQVMESATGIEPNQRLLANNVHYGDAASRTTRNLQTEPGLPHHEIQGIWPVRPQCLQSCLLVEGLIEKLQACRLCLFQFYSLKRSKSLCMRGTVASLRGEKKGNRNPGNCRFGRNMFRRHATPLCGMIRGTVFLMLLPWLSNHKFDPSGTSSQSYQQTLRFKGCALPARVPEAICIADLATTR